MVTLQWMDGTCVEVCRIDITGGRSNISNGFYITRGGHEDEQWILVQVSQHCFSNYIKFTQDAREGSCMWVQGGEKMCVRTLQFGQLENGFKKPSFTSKTY